MLRTLTAAATVGGLLVLAAPATACSVALPQLTLDRARVAPGEAVRVGGEVVADEKGEPEGCVMPTFPVPTTPEPTSTGEPTETATPSETPVPSETPPETATPTGAPVPIALRLVAAVAPGPAEVVVSLLSAADPAGSARTIGTVSGTVQPSGEDGLFTYAFSGTVTIPAGLTAGGYVVEAEQPGGAYFGRAELTVVEGLVVTGGNAGDLTRLAFLSIVCGAAILALSRRVRRS